MGIVIQRKYAELLAELAMRRGGRVVEGTRLLILYRQFCQISSHHGTLENQGFFRF
jgi:hypothetical protein